VTGGSVDVDEVDVVGGRVEVDVVEVDVDVVEVDVDDEVDVDVEVELVVLDVVLVDVDVGESVPEPVPDPVAVPVPVSGGSKRPRTTNSLLQPAFARAAKASHKSSKSDRARAEWALML